MFTQDHRSNLINIILLWVTQMCAHRSKTLAFLAANEGRSLILVKHQYNVFSISGDDKAMLMMYAKARK